MTSPMSRKPANPRDEDAILVYSMSMEQNNPNKAVTNNLRVGTSCNSFHRVLRNFSRRMSSEMVSTKGLVSELT